jgi:HlyD family secretion protein
MLFFSIPQRLTSPSCITFCTAVALAVVGCHRAATPDAYGNFEANEVSVSSQASGQLLSFTPVEGARLRQGELAGIVDTSQLSLQRAQIIAQQQATSARVAEAGNQIGVYTAQLDIARRNYERMQRLLAEHAATAQQRDQAERDYKTLIAQIAAARAQQQSVSREVSSATAQVAEISDRIRKSKIINPEAGTVLATYVKEGEVVQNGQPLYKIADVDTLILRAYVTEKQLSTVKLGQHVQVHVDQGGKLISLPGIVRWISSKAEFTPTPVQTRDERADLVYAIKIYVVNSNGAAKIGMPADVSLAAPPRTT